MRGKINIHEQPVYNAIIASGTNRCKDHTTSGNIISSCCLMTKQQEEKLYESLPL
jgi:hypothetical protein